MITLKMHLTMRASARPTLDTHTNTHKHVQTQHTHIQTQTQTTFCDWVKEAIEGFSQVKEHFLINDDEP